MYKKYFQYEAYLLLDNPDKKSIISFVKKLAAFSSVWLFNRSSVVEVDVVVVVVVVEVVVVTDVVVVEVVVFKACSFISATKSASRKACTFKFPDSSTKSRKSTPGGSLIFP